MCQYTSSQVKPTRCNENETCLIIVLFVYSSYRRHDVVHFHSSFECFGTVLFIWHICEA
jgi:hypothetical protein